MKKQVAIVLSAALITGLAWYLFLISPLLQKRAEISAMRTELEGKLADYRKIMVEFPGRFQMEKEIAAKKKMLVAQLYTKDELIDLFSKMRAAASNLGLSLLEISPSVEELLEINRKIKEEDQPQQLNMMIRLSGRFQDLGGFVKSIENEKYYQGTNYCHITGTAGGNALPEMAYGFRAFLGMIKES